jgi:hypothetical protein
MDDVQVGNGGGTLGQPGTSVNCGITDFLFYNLASFRQQGTPRPATQQQRGRAAGRLGPSSG